MFHLGATHRYQKLRMPDTTAAPGTPRRACAPVEFWSSTKASLDSEPRDPQIRSIPYNPRRGLAAAQSAAKMRMAVREITSSRFTLAASFFGFTAILKRCPTRNRLRRNQAVGNSFIAILLRFFW